MYLDGSGRLNYNEISNLNQGKTLDWLYQDSNVHMTRKHKVYLKCKKIRNK